MAGTGEWRRTSASDANSVRPEEVRGPADMREGGSRPMPAGSSRWRSWRGPYISNNTMLVGGVLVVSGVGYYVFHYGGRKQKDREAVRSVAGGGGRGAAPAA